MRQYGAAFLYGSVPEKPLVGFPEGAVLCVRPHEWVVVSVGQQRWYVAEKDGTYVPAMEIVDPLLERMQQIEGMSGLCPEAARLIALAKEAQITGCMPDLGGLRTS